MKWSVEFGDKFEFYQAISDKGEPSPLDTMPTLDLAESLYYNDFTELGSERNNGMSVGAIPVTRMIIYANQEGVHDIELFKRILLAIDRSYLQMINDDQKKKSKSKKS